MPKQQPTLDADPKLDAAPAPPVSLKWY
jgi:hypothetical protein